MKVNAVANHTLGRYDLKPTNDSGNSATSDTKVAAPRNLEPTTLLLTSPTLVSFYNSSGITCEMAYQ
jgi:hypothetical protein